MESFGAHSRSLIKVISKLEELNIDSTLPSLQSFVVVGDQSAGKSSIVEALCDISLPRSSGTTTRCPSHITTSSQTTASGGWACKVSIKQKYEFDINTGTGEWKKSADIKVNHFATVTAKTELDYVLRRAQFVVLNPDHDPQSSVDLDLTGNPNTLVAFSPIILCLEIQAPHLPELVFYDLPGCINV